MDAGRAVAIIDINSVPLHAFCPLLAHTLVILLSKAAAVVLVCAIAIMSQLSTKVADDLSLIGQDRAVRMWSYISEQLVSSHEAVYQQHEIFMGQWRALKDLLDRERDQDDNHTRQLKEKDAELERLRTSLTDQAMIIQQYRQCSVRFDFVTQETECTFTPAEDDETIHNLTRDERQKGQAQTLAQNLTTNQRTSNIVLPNTNAFLQSQLSSLASKLKMTKTDLEATRTRCASAECCAHTIAELNARAVTAEAKAIESQRMSESLQKENHDHKRALARLKQKRQTKVTEYNRQLKLRRTEYCDLQRDFDELIFERQHLLDQLTEETVRSTAHSVEIEAVKARTTDLEVEKSELQRRFDATYTEHQTMETKVTTQASHIAVLEHEIAVAKSKLSKIRLQTEQSHELRQCSEELRKLELSPEKFCDPSHRKFSYLTDCGTLLCRSCVPMADDTCSERVFGAGAGQQWEIDQCPWCHADMWSWQKLGVPYSLDYVKEFSMLWKVVNPSCP